MRVKERLVCMELSSVLCHMYPRDASWSCRLLLRRFIEHLLCVRHYDPTVNKADRILVFMGLTGYGIRVQEAERELIC